MKKNILKLICIICIILEVLLFILYNNSKKEIGKILNIDNSSDFKIEDIRESLGVGSDNPFYITFKISIDKYNYYNLQYSNVSSSSMVYEGEITNKKQKIDDNYYMCYYEKVLYSKDEKDKIKNIKRNMFYLKLNTIVTIIVIFIEVIKIIKLKTKTNEINNESKTNDNILIKK